MTTKGRAPRAPAAHPPSPSGRPPQDRAIRSRARILECAAKTFASLGYDSASLNDIVRAAGLTKGAVYFHFRSKEALALAVFRAKQAELLTKIRAAVRPSTDGLQTIRVMLSTRARLLQTDPSLGGFLRLAMELGGKFGPDSEFAASYEVPLSALEQLVRRGQREGVIRRTLNARAVAEVIFAAVLGTDEMSRVVGGGQDLVRRTDRWLAVMSATLAPSKRPRRATSQATGTRITRSHTRKA